MNNNENTTKKVISTFLDSAIILAISSCIIYIVAFLFLKGFYSFYGLTDIEINMSLFNVLKISMSIVHPLISWFISFFLISIAMAKISKNPNLQTVLSIVGIYMLCMMFISLSRYTTNKWEHNIYIALYWVITISMALIQPLLMILPDKITSKIYDYLEKRQKQPLFYLYKIFIIICSISFILSFIPQYGFNEAKIKKDYLYDFTNQRVLIYQDNEKTVFLPKNEDDTFEKKYIIVSSAELSELIFEHYEKEVVFIPRNDDFEETQNEQTEEVQNYIELGD